jgi:hypothetical protein
MHEDEWATSPSANLGHRRFVSVKVVPASLDIIDEVGALRERSGGDLSFISINRERCLW